MAVQVFLPPQEQHQAKQHADAGRAEAVLPAQRFAQIAADQRGEQCAQVDACVEKRKARVAPGVVFLVQLADDGGDVGLEKTHAHDDQCQRHIGVAQRALVADDFSAHTDRGIAFERHARMPQHQQQAAEHHRLAHAQPAVGQQASNHRYAVHQAAIGAQQVVAGLVREQVVLGEVQQQQRHISVKKQTYTPLGWPRKSSRAGIADRREADKGWPCVESRSIAAPCCPPALDLPVASL